MRAFLAALILTLIAGVVSAGTITDSKAGSVPVQITYGTSANTAAQGNDSRIVNATQIKATVALTNQSADISSTNISNTSTAGLYRIEFVIECTTADGSAGSVQVQLAWTDGAGSATYVNSQNSETGTISLSATGRFSGVILAQVASGNVAYSTAHSGNYGTSKYAVYISAERVL
jgi:hypothetical protein